MNIGVYVVRLLLCAPSERVFVHLLHVRCSSDLKLGRTLNPLLKQAVNKYCAERYITSSEQHELRAAGRGPSALCNEDECPKSNG